MQIRTPYLLFLGDVADQLAAKTAQGIVDWRREWCLGQLRLPGCKADLGIPDLSITEAAAKEARTLIVGVVNSGGFMPDAWTATIVEAIEAGLDVASGLHTRLGSKPEIAAAAERHGRQLWDVRHSDQHGNDYGCLASESDDCFTVPDTLLVRIPPTGSRVIRILGSKDTLIVHLDPGFVAPGAQHANRSDSSKRRRGGN